MNVEDVHKNKISIEAETAEDLYKAVENITGKREFSIISKEGLVLPRDSGPLTRYTMNRRYLTVVGVLLPKPAIPYEEQYVKYVLRYEGNIKIPPAETRMRQDDLLAIIESEIRGSLIDSSISSATIGQKRARLTSGTLLTNVRTDVVIPTISDPIEVTFTPTAAAASYGGRKKGKSKSKSKSIRRKQLRRRTCSRSQRR
jgi:hypothetical protein